MVVEDKKPGSEVKTANEHAAKPDVLITMEPKISNEAKKINQLIEENREHLKQLLEWKEIDVSALLQQGLEQLGTAKPAPIKPPSAAFFTKTESVDDKKKKFLHELKTEILETGTWPTGLGGTKVQIDENRTVVMPNHIARIYGIINTLTAESNKDQIDEQFESVLAEIDDALKQDSGIKRVLNKLDVLHWFTRSQRVQAFYTKTKEKTLGTPPPSIK